MHHQSQYITNTSIIKLHTIHANYYAREMINIMTLHFADNISQAITISSFANILSPVLQTLCPPRVLFESLEVLLLGCSQYSCQNTVVLPLTQTYMYIQHEN